MSIGAVVIDNPPLEVRREFVEVRTRIVERNGTFEEERIEPELAIGFAGESRWVVRLGSWPRCQRLLEDAGYEVVVEDRRDIPERFQPVYNIGVDVDNEGMFFLTAIRDAYRGIWACKPEERNRRIAEVCRLFARAKIAVICQNKKDARILRFWLKNDLQEQIGLALRSGEVHHQKHTVHADWTDVESIPPDQQERIFVCTPAGLSTNAVQGEHLAILADAQNAAGSNYSECVSLVCKRMVRCFGLVPLKWTPPVAQRLRFESLCGEWLQPPAAPPVLPNVIVLPSRCPNTPDVVGAVERRRVLYTQHDYAAGHDGEINTANVERRRVLYTQHDRRNTEIARIARAIYECDFDELSWKVPRELHPHLRRVIERKNVAVVCEGREQAEAVARHLRAWVVFCYTAGMKITTDAVGWFICTSVYAAKQGVLADVVVRAGGGGGRLHIKWLSENPERFVIDFDDRFHKSAISDTQKRLACYHKTGWFAYGFTAAPTARPSAPA